ncbi:O-antigen ligase family protein [Arundinibacter roseus]|uniref:O-antigen ligase domain-containing protein n=1 Tax=Arundinibacter roseus TaxID=2070510 RepID=A0A4R4K7F0_9BACT|nr:O-antigen ligase family protein [Arundinibacter roseus]TDB63478.1 O-antigen ligase domain-containing protein [Arundinibacter roseus]
MSSATPPDSVIRHPLFWLLSFNMALVIFGYALGVLTGMASVTPMRYLKYSFLLISIFYLLKENNTLLKLLSHYLQPLAALSLIFIAFALLSANPLNSILGVLTFIIPFLYVAFSMGALLLRYSIREVLHAFLDIINWIYFIPIISFFITGGSLTDTNIYFVSAENEESAFVSNHYGWSGTIFLLTSMDLLRNVSLPVWRRILLIVFSAIAAYLALISGNRTSWLSLALVSLVFLIMYKQVPLYQKLILSVLPITLVFYLLNDPKSALNARFEKTKSQQEKGEPRANLSTSMIDHFNETPDLWLTGIGMFNKERIKTISGWSGYHNSYLEVLFGSGIIVFSFFLYLIVFRPLFIYLRYFSSKYLFFIPLLIIPYFESNLTGGQFLFFPWFVMALLMSYAQTFAKIKLLMNSQYP